MDPLKRFVLTLRLRRTSYSVVEQCAIFARLLGVRAKVVQGWACSNNQACQHYWVEYNSEVFDVGRAYSTLFEPSLAAIQTQLITSLDGAIEVIGDDDPIIKHNRELYTLYTDDPKTFWKGVKPFKYSL